MTRVNIAKLKDNLSRFLRAVEAGDEVEVTDRGRPIARILPISRGPHLIPAHKPFSQVRGKRHRPGPWEVDILEVLMEERRER